MNKQKPVILKEYSYRKQPSKINENATVIKTVWNSWRQTLRPTEWNREPRNKPLHTCSDNLWHDKTIQWGKENVFNKWCWGEWISKCKRTKLDPYFTPAIFNQCATRSFKTCDMGLFSQGHWPLLDGPIKKMTIANTTKLYLFLLNEWMN